MSGKKRMLLLAMTVAVILSSSACAEVDEAAAKAEYEQLMAELQQAQAGMPMNKLMDRAEKGLLGIIEKYPGSAASGSAMVMLAQVYSQTGRTEEAKKQINTFFNAGLDKDPKETAMAWMFLGQAMLADDDFEGAEKAFKTMATLEGIDPKMAEMAHATLGRLETMKKLKIGNEAIGFKTDDLEGKPISLSDYRGKVVLVDFWATWCAPCRQEMPNVKKVYANYHEKGFDIVGISMDNSRDALVTYIKEQEMPWRQIYDGRGWKAEIGQLYAVASIPATFLIDKQGRIRNKNLRGGDLEKAVKKLLSEK